MSAKRDFLAIAVYDPTILTLRRCTSADIRNLATLASMPMSRARRAFNCCLFQRTSYLTRSLDPAFEPQEHIRERAKATLERRRNPQLATTTQKVQQPPASQPPVPIKQKAAPKVKQKAAPKKQHSRLSRYTFD